MKLVPFLLCLIGMLVSEKIDAQGNELTDSDHFKIEMKDRFIIDSSNDGKERQFPFVYKFGKNIFVSYSEHPDGYVTSPADAMIISRDNGKTWTEKTIHRDFYITSMFQKKDTLYGVVYFTYRVSPEKEKMIYWTSSDLGKSWVKHEGIVHSPEGKQFTTIQHVWSSMLFHRGMMVMEDGSIQGLMYGYLNTQQKYTCAWVKSVDNCANWQIVSIIASGAPTAIIKNAEGYGEPAFAKTRDGSLLCVMRIGSFLPLFQSRSYDNGLSWSKAVPLPGISAQDAESVDPQLLLLKSGVLALTYGRPGNKMAFSLDGCGYQWEGNLDTYKGETTGYTGIVETNPGTIFLIADQGRTGAKQKAIWGRFIDIDTDCGSIKNGK